jgi:hypothetical protein
VTARVIAIGQHINKVEVDRRSRDAELDPRDNIATTCNAIQTRSTIGITFTSPLEVIPGTGNQAGHSIGGSHFQYKSTSKTATLPSDSTFTQPLGYYLFIVDNNSYPQSVAPIIPYDNVYPKWYRHTLNHASGDIVTIYLKIS